MMIVTPSIIFNNKKYPIDESALAPATAELKSHLSTVMNGSGAMVELDGTSYNVDSTKLSSARNEFIAHLGTIAGNGLNITVNGVRYSIDSSKVASVISDLEVVLGKLENPDDGDSEFVAGLYQTGAVALYQEQGADAIKDMLITPWDEFVKRGSVVVDNGVFYTGYALPDNLPEKNEYGFYYDTPYSEYSHYGDSSYIWHEDGSFEGWYEGALVVSCEAGTAVYSQNIIDMSSCDYGVFNVYDDGKVVEQDGWEISVSIKENFAGDLILPNDAGITSMGDYYLNKDSHFFVGHRAFGTCDGLTGVLVPNCVTDISCSSFAECILLNNVVIPNSVTTIGDTAFSDCSSLTGIVIPNSVTSIGECAFSNCSSLTGIEIPNSITSIEYGVFMDCSNLNSVTIPNSVTTIGGAAFCRCPNLTNIIFNGTISQWNAIDKRESWNADVPATKVVCTDGEVAI